MLTEYIDEALKRTRYELIQDEEPYYGEIKALPGIWASGRARVPEKPQGGSGRLDFAECQERDSDP